jgi:hypothetical protein
MGILSNLEIFKNISKQEVSIQNNILNWNFLFTNIFKNLLIWQNTPLKHFLYKFYVTVCYTNDCRCSIVLLMMDTANARNM